MILPQKIFEGGFESLKMAIDLCGWFGLVYLGFMCVPTNSFYEFVHFAPPTNASRCGNKICPTRGIQSILYFERGPRKTLFHIFTFLKKYFSVR